MSSDVFWQRWWKILRHQPAVWFFILLAQVPGLLMIWLSAPIFLALPPLDAPPAVWEAWLQRQRDVLLGAGLALTCVMVLLGLAIWVLSVWAQAGIITTVRRVWGREDEPLPWDEARRGLGGPTLRLLLLQLVLILVGALVAVLLFGALVGILAFGSSDDPGPFIAVLLLGGLCLLLPLVFLVAPWIWGLMVAVVAEYPASWRETWDAFWRVARRAWLAFYAMFVIYLTLNFVLSLVKQILLMPLTWLAFFLAGEPSNWLQALSAVISGTVQVVLQAVTQVIGVTGWTVLYLHYREQEIPSPGARPAGSWAAEAVWPSDPASPEAFPAEPDAAPDEP